MNNPPTRAQRAKQGHGSDFHPLVRLTEYAFLLQGVIFAAFVILLVGNVEFFKPHPVIE